MSDLNTAIARADALAFASNGKHLNDLQRKILTGVWHGDRYAIIAERYGYTEGHIKDMGADLWQMLSQATGERIGKSNFRSAIGRQDLAPSAGPSPFSTNFFGRQAALEKIDATIQQGQRAIVIQGEGGVGKTTLAQQYLASKNFDRLLELFMAKEARNIAPAATIVQEWLGRDFNEEPGRDFITNLARLKRQLQTQRTGILIDNLEPALDRDGCFQADHRDYIELLRILSDTRSQAIVLVTSRDRLCEADLHFIHLRLSGLSTAAWSEYFTARGLEMDPNTTAALQKIYGGNAKAMGIIGGAIATDFAGDGRAYWQEYGNEPLAEISLKNLISRQFDRLQNLDPLAYRLLCRLGCYRYQDIASVPVDGLLCLLWEEATPRRTIASLRNRSLVECARGHYWLHPAIRAEAISRLQPTPDWERSHQRAAEFWRNRVTKIANITDALTAFEAYYHELAIGDFAAAARTILKGRTNQWGQFLSLGSNLYRLGLVQPILAAVLQICDRLSTPELAAELQNILGDLYWICGRMSEAIACQEKTISLARQGLQNLDPERSEYRDIYYFQMLEVDSFLSIGLYNLDQGEFERAAERFERVIALAAHTDRQGWADKASICLALARSHLGEMAAARGGIARFEAVLDDLEAGRWAYFLQLLGQVYERLGDAEKARNASERAIAAARAGHYRQVEAKALVCLAQIAAGDGNFAAARTHCERAIALLAAMGAQCDLASAHYQFGLLLQQAGEDAESHDRLEQALALFTSIQAPKQVKRVRAAIASV